MTDDELAPDWMSIVERYGPTLSERVHGWAALRTQQARCRRFCAALGAVQICGLENVPSEGPVILAVNHRSFVDGPLLFGFVDRPVSSLVKVEAFRPLGGRAGRVLAAAGQIPLRRGGIDPAPVRLTLRILHAGGVVGIFPEGTRGSGQVRTARPGVGYLALRTGASVVPVAIAGSAEMVRRRSVRPAALMAFGQPVRFPAPPAGMILRRTAWLAVTETLRLRLADLVAETFEARDASTRRMRKSVR
jgi:1-acyl-sn-glycerol-3-phosphate acyltransferase